MGRRVQQRHGALKTSLGDKWQAESQRHQRRRARVVHVVAADHLRTVKREGDECSVSRE